MLDFSKVLKLWEKMVIDFDCKWVKINMYIF